ncbi:MAG: hypothetical protein UX80_C0026G0003 [Candidatus Amesbacteria bacterium GW2011_GWA2_47_11b]|uniref:Nucleotidyl transferase AbiEii/AbiGii toxin family protein n=3 Tax=Candidatus Amesiibacteriota TaxID=1752730 RepID=A0A0G1ULH2_9BACT|nr:MAG: hypothetical protein UX42_C0024G0003 [Microgenomates group bacterium GW2011_GWC1_46_20]KKU57092.1 MAG: hypothetical protein UX80_C0026G0003 [Candidatus Amesbacteria bacterium GW2011_GWA2_47_11b]KKU66933.1 MAG: hypothetical protein UX92_C0034G0003 [Candidatus Amesbacteria bacterium GW2011_GWA1_47_20]KKU83880.1 MAG: hypothetical protein UY11_C0012G0015 [Candidatus Amesbacteria bacterium GW2011_GWC2_47_8]
MLNTSLHRQIILQVLKSIYSNPSLGSALGFKGGTAAYLLYGLPRFSIDLDFNLLDSEKEIFVFENMSKLLSEYGTLEEKANKHYTLFYLLRYKSGLRNLKIEISKRSIVSQYETRAFLGIPMRVMSQPDMFANKLIALTERKQLANRDIFDVHFFFKQNWVVNTKLIEKHTQISYSQYLERCIQTIENVSSESMLANMGELVDNQTKYWIKNHLKEETLFLLRTSQDPVAD